MMRRVVVHSLIALALGSGCFVAYSEMRRYVDQSVEQPTEPPLIVFKDRPTWMTDLVASQLAASFRPAKPLSVFDREVLVQTTKKLKANPWIDQVHQVRRVYGAQAGDTIEVSCDFRAPMALVQNGSDYWFVDSQGIKLPERFVAEDVRKIVFSSNGRTNIRVIEGVHNRPPQLAGHKWTGEDLAAGLELVRRLYGVPFADEIVQVNVENFGGRIDPREAQLVLVTRYNTHVRWGRPWGSVDAFIEVRPEVKLDRLRSIVDKYGRVDAKQRWVDVRFDKITYPTPAPSSDLAGTHAEAAR
jgi:hypothetical protein